MVVGITMLKLAKRKSTKARTKHTGQLDAVLQEAMAERKTRDPDVDRNRTQYNTYILGYGKDTAIRTGEELGAELESRAAEYSAARRAAGGRGVREDAGLGIAVIIKPPMEEIMSWPEPYRDLFLRDAGEALDKIMGPENLVGGVIHRDENADHAHRYYAPYKDGKLDADAFCNPRIWLRINTEWSAEMRRRGWDGVEHNGITRPRVDDPELFDQDRAAKDPEYLEARRQKRKNFGRQSKEYKAAKDAERRAIERRNAKDKQGLEALSKILVDRESALYTQKKAQEAARTKLEEQATQQAQEAARITQEALEVAQGRANLATEREALEAKRKALEESLGAKDKEYEELLKDLRVAARGPYIARRSGLNYKGAGDRAVKTADRHRRQPSSKDRGLGG